MNREQAKKIWPFVKAFGEGEDVRYAFNDGKRVTELAFGGIPENYIIVPPKPEVLRIYSDKYVALTDAVKKALNDAGIEL